MKQLARIAAVALIVLVPGTAIAQESSEAIAVEGDPDTPSPVLMTDDSPGRPLIEPRFATPLVLPSPAQPLERQQYWVTEDNYPTRALREGREGSTRFYVVVNEQGRVESCTVTESSGHEDLDNAACRSVRRNASFVPAFDGDGNAIKGTFSNIVKWTIPEVPKRPRSARLREFKFIRQVDYPIESWNAGEEGLVRYAVDLDTEGKALDCRISESSGFEALDAATCRLVMERAEFWPANSAEGVRIPATYEGGHNWQKREPDFPNMVVKQQFILGKDGAASKCEIVRMEGDFPDSFRRELERSEEDGSPCFGRGARTSAPFRDANGIPVAKQVTMSLEVIVEDLLENTGSED